MKVAIYSLSCTVLILLFALNGVRMQYRNVQRDAIRVIQSKAGESYHANIPLQLAANTNFRKVLYTGARSQLVLMDIPPGGDVGEEVHPYTEQTLFFASGVGQAIVGGAESSIIAGDVVVVPPGTKHNFINTGTTALQIYTVYAPPNHLPGTLETTKASADQNIADETYGDTYK